MAIMNYGYHEVWLLWTMAIMNYGYHELWLSWTMAIMKYGYHELWLSWTMAIMNYGYHASHDHDSVKGVRWNSLRLGQGTPRAEDGSTP